MLLSVSESAIPRPPATNSAPCAACSFLPSRFLPRSPLPTDSRLCHFCPSSSPFFSYKYELPILQVLCFDNDPTVPGVYPPPHYPLLATHSPYLL
jgi:hypothetical protein